MTPHSPDQSKVWIRVAFTLSLIIAFAALLLFGLVSVYFVPFIVEWKAAQPLAFLGFYLFLFALTVLPFVAARYFARILFASQQRHSSPKALFVFAGLFLIPALILLPQVGSAPHILDKTEDAFVLGIPGVLCVLLSVILAHRGIVFVRKAP